LPKTPLQAASLAKATRHKITPSHFRACTLDMEFNLSRNKLTQLSATCLDSPPRSRTAAVTMNQYSQNNFLLDPSPAPYNNRPRYRIISYTRGPVWSFQASTPPKNSVGKPDTRVPTEPSPVSAPTPHAPWSPAVRIAFRIAFLYFFCFVVVGADGTLLQAFPFVGGWHPRRPHPNPNPNAHPLPTARARLSFHQRMALRALAGR
jgi:hypothetical protein